MSPIDRNYFAQPTLTVAQALLGQHLVRELEGGHRLIGRIVETEAYIGPDDSANHASKGRTPRTQVMFGPPGRAYVYLIYGMYYMLNVVTEAQDFPAAVLIRAVEPVEGLSLMQLRRPRVKKTVNLTNGPGKLCQALAIDQRLHNWDVTMGKKLWLAPGQSLPDETIATGPRMGIGYARPEDQTAAWRFWIKDNRFVST